jgi:hypothetical protein
VRLLLRRQSFFELLSEDFMPPFTFVDRYLMLPLRFVSSAFARACTPYSAVGRRSSCSNLSSVHSLKSVDINIPVAMKIFDEFLMPVRNLLNVATNKKAPAFGQGGSS